MRTGFGCPCNFFASWTDFTWLGPIRLVRQRTKTAGKSNSSKFVGQHIKRVTRWRSWLRLQAGRSRFQLPMVSLEFLLPYPSGPSMALGSTQPLTEMSTRNISQPVRRAGMCLFSWNLGTSTSGHIQARNGIPLTITHTVTDIHATNVIKLYIPQTRRIYRQRQRELVPQN